MPANIVKRAKNQISTSVLYLTILSEDLTSCLCQDPKQFVNVCMERGETIIIFLAGICLATNDGDAIDMTYTHWH